MFRHPVERTLAASFEQNGVTRDQQLVHQLDCLTLLQKGLAAGNFNQSAVRREAVYLVLDLGQRHALAALEGVFAVAPGAAQIAPSQPNEDARYSRVGRLTLQRLVNLDDLHALGWRRASQLTI